MVMKRVPSTTPPTREGRWFYKHGGKPEGWEAISRKPRGRPDRGRQGLYLRRGDVVRPIEAR